MEPLTVIFSVLAGLAAAGLARLVYETAPSMRARSRRRRRTNRRPGFLL